jgi:hypothetical protein
MVNAIFDYRYVLLKDYFRKDKTSIRKSALPDEETHKQL